MVRTFEVLNARILVADDLESNVLLLERMLRGAGYERVESTMDSREVCELHRQNRYTLILLDLKMPGMDGFQVMEGIKALEPDGPLPVLVITAEPGHKLRALRAGARDFVSKPLDLAEVLMRVHNLIEVRLLHEATKRLYDQLMEERRSQSAPSFLRPGSNPAHCFRVASEDRHTVTTACRDVVMREEARVVGRVRGPSGGSSTRATRISQRARKSVSAAHDGKVSIDALR